MAERFRIREILSEDCLVVRTREEDGKFITDVIRTSEKSDLEMPPISFWRDERKAIIEVNSNFVDLSKQQREAALLFVYINLDGDTIPDRIIWDFDTTIPPDKLEGIVTYTTHKIISSV